jgi:hypothetical protein
VLDGNDEVMWTQGEITECLLSIAFFIAIERMIRESRAADSSLSYLSQLKYFFVSLVGDVRRKMYDDKRISELVNNEKAFGREFDAFWRQALYAIKAEWKHNERNEIPMTLRTFARSKKVWDTVRESFNDLRSAGIAPGT